MNLRFRNLPITKKNKKLFSVVAIISLFLLINYVFLPYNQQTNYQLKNEVILENISENEVGKVIIRKRTALSFVKNRNLQACVYTGNESSPVILPVEYQPKSYEISKIVTQEVIVSIPEEKTGRNYSLKPVNVSMKKDCPLRSTKKIVITQEN